MNTYRISKYNPEYRKNGIYLKDEWTDYSDIGDKFDGKMFTKQEYLRVEQNYISCILTILENSGATQLFIDGYEDYTTNAWKNGQYLTTAELPQLIQDCLRNKCWCKLKGNQAYVHFSDDFYFYIGCNLSNQNVEALCQRYNLFCEVRHSPYSPG